MDAYGKPLTNSYTKHWATNDETTDSHWAAVLGVGEAPELAQEEEKAAARLPIPLDVRERVYEEAGGHCAYCGTDKGPFHIDHITPVLLGGTNDFANLALACQGCNGSKGGKTMNAWLAWRRQRQG